MDRDEAFRMIQFLDQTLSLHRDQTHESLRSHQAELNNSLDSFVTDCTGLVKRLEALEEKRHKTQIVTAGSPRQVVVTAKALADLGRYMKKRERWSPRAWWRRFVGDHWRSFCD